MPRMFTPAVLLFAVLLTGACDNAMDQPATAPDASAAVAPESTPDDAVASSTCSAPVIITPTGGVTVHPNYLIFQHSPQVCLYPGELEVYNNATNALVFSDSHLTGMGQLSFAVDGTYQYMTSKLVKELTPGVTYRWRVRTRRPSAWDWDLTELWSPWSSYATFVYSEVPDLDASIDGPSSLVSPGTYTWTANADGGTGAYSYEWFYRIDATSGDCNFQTPWTSVGTGETYSRTIPGPDYDFSLRLVVTSNGASTSTTKKVFMNIGQSPHCPW